MEDGFFSITVSRNKDFMQSYRVSRNLPALTRTTSNALQSSKPSNMACLTLSPRYHTRPVSYFHRPAFPFAEVEALFSPFFECATAPARSRGSNFARTFQPRFDVKETPEAFHLQGELPGLSARDVDIQFADNNTLTIHGRVVRESERGDRSLVEGANGQAAVTEGESTAAAEPAEGSEKSSLHQATVEDEDAAQASAATSTAAPATPATTTAAEAKPEPEKASQSKYWISERSVGGFHRTFNFPGLVDHSAVKASLKDGILNLEVPKVKRQEPRKIAIE